jgi:hypothetical protein
VAFVWELTEETIHLPLGCLQGGRWHFPSWCDLNRSIWLTVSDLHLGGIAVTWGFYMKSEFNQNLSDKKFSTRILQYHW